jgi:integrase/recombinase XerD
MAVLCTFREPSLCRHVHRELMRNAVLDLTPIIPTTACHQSNYVERYSRFRLPGIPRSLQKKEIDVSDLHNLPHGHLLHFLSSTNQDRVAAYLTLLQARQYAPSSLEQIITSIKSFCLLLPEHQRQRMVQDFAHTTPEDVDIWLDIAAGHGLAPATLATRLRILWGFFTYLTEQGYLPQQPIRRHRHAVTVPQHLPRPMADEDVVAFFRVIDVLRDRLLFLLMLRCGLRVSEVCALTWAAVNWDQGTIRVDNSKGQVDRIVYFSPDVETTMRQWHRLQAPGVSSVFPSRHKHKAGAPLRVNHIHGLMARYVAQAGLQKRYTTHCLRHTFATSLLNADASLEVIKELMGHTSLDLTLRYAQLYEATKRQQYDQAMDHIERRRALNRR